MSGHLDSLDPDRGLLKEELVVHGVHGRLSALAAPVDDEAGLLVAVALDLDRTDAAVFDELVVKILFQAGI